METTVVNGSWLEVDWGAVVAIATVLLLVGAFVAARYARRNVIALREQLRLLEQTLHAQTAAHIAVEVMQPIPMGVPLHAYFVVPGSKAAAIAYRNYGVGAATAARVRLWVRGYDTLPEDMPHAADIETFGDPHWISDRRTVAGNGENHPFLVADNPDIPEIRSAPRLVLIWETVWTDLGGRSDSLIGLTTLNF